MTTFRGVLGCAVAALCIARVASAAPYKLLGWNDLGMHCMDGAYAVYSILPPYNNIHAQLIDPNGKLVTNPSGMTVAYAAVQDADASINTSSARKTNFWAFVQALFGASPAADTGLTGNSMPGPANREQPMKFDGSLNWFTADGIPITSYDDNFNKNYYPMMRLTARDASGNVLATTDIVLPISDEMNCSACHSSGTGLAKARPAGGWVNDPQFERDYKLNVLRLHDERQSSLAAYAQALATAGYNGKGLFATVVSDGKPVLCGTCHPTNALGIGQSGVSPLTQAIHGFHATVADPSTGVTLGADTNRNACYQCHPGSQTRCLRGAMGAAVAADGTMAIQCQNCHGGMAKVGAVGRQGWLQEPTCQNCHTGDAASNAGQIRFTSAFDSSGNPRQPSAARFTTKSDTPAAGLSLFRFSSGHGGLQCAACHGSTHAEFPSTHANDNVQSLKFQGYAGTVSDCGSCHASVSNTLNGGPHGMHVVGQSWVSAHERYAEGNRAQCQPCHGTDYRGTVLSLAYTTRTLNAGRYGTKNLYRGFQVGCYLCHNGPGGEGQGSSQPPAANNASASTAAGTPVTIALNASASNLRIVSHASGGSVGLNGNTATYFPFNGYEGQDSFTFAAWDGMSNSNLATVNVTVTASQRPSFDAPALVNAASYAGGAVSPGEMITIFGAGMGPNALLPLQMNSAGLVSRLLGNTRVLFDGNPAPLIYTSAGQIAAMAPYAVAGKSSTQVQVEYGGIRSTPVSLPVAAAAVGLFSVDATGRGQGAILNQDNSVNSASNPAAKGSTVMLFGTGEGKPGVDVVDGQLVADASVKPTQNVKVTIGGVDAPVAYAGGAPGMVAGFLQVNVTVPQNVPSGAVPVIVTVGNSSSQSGITLAVK